MQSGYHVRNHPVGLLWVSECKVQGFGSGVVEWWSNGVKKKCYSALVSVTQRYSALDRRGYFKRHKCHKRQPGAKHGRNEVAGGGKKKQT